MSSRRCLFALLLGAVAPLSAGTLIDGKDETGGSHRIMIEGEWARMEYGEDAPPEYLLLNLKNHKAFAVDRVRKRAVDLSEAPDQAPPRDRAAAASFKKTGAGPVIAGYATEHYVLRAGKTVCGDHYVAAKTLTLTDISSFIAAMRAYSESQTAEQDNPVRAACAAAEDLADAEYARLGLPLRVTDEQGNLVHEVNAIRVNVKFPAGTFNIPTTYTMTTPRALMEQLKREAADRSKQPDGPMDAATVKRLREQQMRQHTDEMQRMHPPQNR